MSLFLPIALASGAAATFYYWEDITAVGKSKRYIRSHAARWTRDCLKAVLSDQDKAIAEAADKQGAHVKVEAPTPEQLAALAEAVAPYCARIAAFIDEADPVSKDKAVYKKQLAAAARFFDENVYAAMRRDDADFFFQTKESGPVAHPQSHKRAVAVFRVFSWPLRAYFNCSWEMLQRG